MTTQNDEQKPAFEYFDIANENKPEKPHFIVSTEYMDGDADHYWNDESSCDTEKEAMILYNFIEHLKECQSNKCEHRDYNISMIAEYLIKSPETVEYLIKQYQMEELTEILEAIANDDKEDDEDPLDRLRYCFDNDEGSFFPNEELPDSDWKASNCGASVSYKIGYKEYSLKLKKQKE